MRSIASFIAAAIALGGGLHEPPRQLNREPGPEPELKPKIKNSSKPAGSKYKSRKKRNKPLFRI